MKAEREKKQEEEKAERKIMFTRIAKLNEFLKTRFIHFSMMDQQLK